MRKIKAEITIDDHEIIKELAIKTGFTQGELIKDLINLGLKEYKKVVIKKDEPADLGTGD